MADVDPEVLEKARETITARVLVEIEKKLRKKLAEYDDPCLQMYFEGTGTPQDGTDVEWDVSKDSGFPPHVNDLETEQLVKDWTIKIPKVTIYDTKKDVCTDPVDSRDVETLDLTLEYPKRSVLFDNFKHGDHHDTLTAKDKSVVKVKAMITLVVRKWQCYSAMLVSDGNEALVTIADHGSSESELSERYSQGKARGGTRRMEG
jgi:hypothetical protein